MTNRYAPDSDEGSRQIRPREVETSLQHKTKSYIRHMTELGISDNRASKVIGSTPGDPLRLSAAVAVERRKMKGTGLPRASALTRRLMYSGQRTYPRGFGWDTNKYMSVKRTVESDQSVSGNVA